MSLTRTTITVLGAAIGLVGLVAILAVLAIAPAADQTSINVETGPSQAALAAIPPQYLTLYEQAAASTGTDWTILAAIGEVETDHGRSTLPGVRSGANSAGAEGPMQFEPQTFRSYCLPIPSGGESPPSPYDPTDAIYAAARDLAANGATKPAGIAHAIYAYNHSQAYVRQVLAVAQTYRQLTIPTPATVSGSVAAAWALTQLGTPYVWGGETPHVAFDCSGLVQAAYAAAHISLPRVAQAQYDTGPHLTADAMPEPGDLVFFGQGPTDITHVGIVLEPGTMIDSPHTGSSVRLDTYPTTPGAPWGTDRYIGATRPTEAHA